MSQTVHVTPLLQVTPAAYHLLIPLLCGPPMAIGGMAVLFAAPGHIIGGVLMTLFGLGLTAIGIRRTRTRTVLIEVTERGIMIYAKPEAIDVSFSLLKDLFIPWERLESMRFLDMKQVGAEKLWVALGSGNAVIRPGCIGLQLRMDAFWPEPGTIRQGMAMRNAKPGEIYLRTAECLPGGKKLWSAMASLATRYAGPHVVVEEAQAVRREG